MNIELTEQQQQALDAQGETPPCVIDPRSNAAYYLVAAADYEAVRELLEEERRQKARHWLEAVGLQPADAFQGSILLKADTAEKRGRWIFYSRNEAAIAGLAALLAKAV